MKLAIGLSIAASALWAQVEDTQTITKRFAVSGAVPEIVVSIISGGIRVTAHDSNEVVLNAKAYYRADDAAQLAELKKNARFDGDQQGNNVWIGVEYEGQWDNGWRRPREYGWRGKTPPERGKTQRGWKFKHDVELRVPRNAHLKLSTVNEGEIAVDGVAGEFSYNNVNGGIDVKGANGFGRAHTVNGPVSLSFGKNPGGALSVKTINGKVRVGLMNGLNANVKLKTMNGRMYSDFSMLANAASPAAMEERNGKRIWKMNGFSNGRIGNGGAEIAIETLNGEIQILENR